MIGLIDVFILEQVFEKLLFSFFFSVRVMGEVVVRQPCMTTTKPSRYRHTLKAATMSVPFSSMT